MTSPRISYSHGICVTGRRFEKEATPCREGERDDEAVSLVLSDRKIDRRTDRHQTTLIDKDGMRGRILSLELISVDEYRQAMPVERFEPSTLAGPVFETGAYTVPPHRLIVISESYNSASIL